MEQDPKCGMRADLIAPCGMNCRLCLGFQREKNHCSGCRNEQDISYRTSGSASCVIKNCPVIKGDPSGFCFKCEKYPCKRLRDLDKRYRTKYHMSMVENLENIKKEGIDAFLQREEQRWTCPACGGIVCVHRAECPACKRDWTKNEQNL